MTTRLRSVSMTRGLPVNYCSGFRSLDIASTSEHGGMYLVSLFPSINSIYNLYLENNFRNMSLSIIFVVFTFFLKNAHLQPYHHASFLLAN